MARDPKPAAARKPEKYDAILRAAGGMTLTLDDQPLTYGKRDRPGIDDFVNPDFVAKGRIDGC